MKKILAIILCAAVLFSFAGCGGKTDRDENKLQIVTTIFPLYDFARQVGGDKVQVTLILPTGGEVHSYEPTPKDVITIKESDLFIAQGGDADPWTGAVINDADSKKLNVLYALDCVTLMSEDHEHLSFSSHVHTDPHVWTTPKNAAKISESISDRLCAMDTENSDYYKEKLSLYKEKLNLLDEKFTALTKNSDKTIVFADQFPFRYFAKEYNLKYLAAFPGCSAESEPTASAVAQIIDTVKKEKIPVVFYTETSNKQLANAVCEETGAKKLLFHSCHSVTDDELKSGVTYLDLMKKNYEALKKAI